jgi:hypothetical protein
MKKIVLGLAVTIISLTAFGQGRKGALESSMRLKAGYNIANITGTERGDFYKENSLNSFHLGIIADLPISSVLSFQGGVLYTGKGIKTEFGNPGEVGYYKATTNPMYVEMPLALMGKIPVTSGIKILVGAGPYGALGITGKNKTELKTPAGLVYGNRDIEFTNEGSSGVRIGVPQLKRFDYGVNASAGFEFKRFTLLANYGHGLSNIVPGTRDDANERGRHRVISFSFGLKI